MSWRDRLRTCLGLNASARSIDIGLRDRLRTHRRTYAFDRRTGKVPLTLARIVVLDLETTGPRMDTDRIISIGAIGIQRMGIRHADSFAMCLRQPVPSPRDNILIHRIGSQQQRSGQDPAHALLEFLEFRRDSVSVAFRAEFDRTVLRRELAHTLGYRDRSPILDIAVLLPAFFPNTPNDTLEQWLVQFGIPFTVRHDAVGDAYATAQLLLVVLKAAQRAGMSSVNDLLAVERAQAWLGRRR